ncbi:MAG: hypothetical protein JWQ43_3561 [Glaciihabitans sp.]|nr:hypothetical protein [Glaciihabitans sp.]
MRLPHLTAQQLDPIGGLTARAFAIASAVGAIATSVVVILATSPQIARPWFDLAAFGFIVLAGVHYIRATSPFRAPFRRADHAIVCLLALAAVVLAAVAQWGSNAAVRDDWAPLALAILTFTFGSWRPAWEIITCAAVGSVVVGVLAGLQAAGLTPNTPAVVIGIVAASPVLASGMAAGTFSHSLVRSLLRWRASVTPEPTTAGTEPGPAAAVGSPDVTGDNINAGGSVSGSGDSVNSDNRGMPGRGTIAVPARHLEHLESQVLPFLHGAISRGTLSEDDAGRARELSQQLRTLMVNDSRRTWLAQLVREPTDPLGIAVLMTTDERSVVQAIVEHLRSVEEYNDATISVSVDIGDGQPSCVIIVDCESSAPLRLALAPYIAVARTVFRAVEWNLPEGSLEIVLTFDAIRNPSPTPAKRG